MRKKKISAHQKALDLMQRETNRAIAHVELLDRLYREMVESKSKAKRHPSSKKEI